MGSAKELALVDEGVEGSAAPVEAVMSVIAPAAVAASDSAVAAAAKASATAAFFLARCSRRSWSVVALAWVSLSSSNLSGTVPKIWLVPRYQ